MQTEASFGNRETMEASSPTEARFGAMHSEGAVATVRSAVQVDAANASTVGESSDAALQLAEDLKKFQKLAAEIRASLAPAADFSARCDQAFSLANDLFGHAPTWVCFFREVLADGGLARKLFSTIEEYEQFMSTSHYDQIQQMLTGLRSRDLPENDPNDPQRMITVRLPKSLHKALCDEARRLNISVNKLCISRLLQILDPKMIPETVSKPRGRKPRTHSEESVEVRPAVVS